MAWKLHAIEQTQLRREYRVDGVGRPKFDFHTQATYNAKAKEDKARYDAALKAAGVLTKAEKKIFVKNCRVHPTHWLISTQLTTPSDRAARSKSCVEIKFRAPHAIDAIFSP